VVEGCVFYFAPLFVFHHYSIAGLAGRMSEDFSDHLSACLGDFLAIPGAGVSVERLLLKI